MVVNTGLVDWQARLSQHFATLRDSRRTRGIGEPLFALEHGLIQTEVEALEEAVRTHIASRPPSRDHWLVWIVYSAELGYRYAGDEYWQTFESATPGWIANGDRYRIRGFYQRFQREFGGAVPSGRWAEHFSIICWPITHAILPKDLQTQLARTLFESSSLLSEDVLGSPELLGDLIAVGSRNASSRFLNLAQETRLLGQIAAALLFQGQAGWGDLIYPATLERISEDLDRERQAREWLRGARRSVNERTRIRGLRPITGRTALSSISRLDDARSAVTVLGIEPRLVLRPRDASGESWDVLLEIPDLSHLLLRFPQAREVLTGSRCVVAGSSGRPLARGRLLYGAQRVKLRKWPKPNEVLLQFESKDSQLDFLLRTECLLRPGSTWLLRVASDGLAYECKGLRVRPGERYIFLSTAGPIDAGRHATSVEVECEGVSAATLDLPSSRRADWQDSIQNLGLGQARTIEVWPAGLAAMAWDGEGHGEWPASERPCLAILADHPLVSLQVSTDTTPRHSIELTSIDPGEPVFLELPHLPVGSHRLKFSARSSVARLPEQLDDQEAMIRIREDRLYLEIADPRVPVIVRVDPSEPTLDQLWEGRCEISIHGPPGRDVNCAISLFERDGESAFFVSRLPPVSLPVTSDFWQTLFWDHFQENKKTQAAYDRARVCTLNFDAGELGTYTVRCEREFTPLRWTVRPHGDGHLVRLYDDSGYAERSQVSRLTFETPCVEETLALQPEWLVTALGGMYAARTGDLNAAIIVPPVLRGRGFNTLGVTPTIEPHRRSLESIIRVIGTVVLWDRARLSGDLLSAIRRQEVMLALIDELFRLICGDRWARAESALPSGYGANSLKALASEVSRNRNRTNMHVRNELLKLASTIAIYTCKGRPRQLVPFAIRHRLVNYRSASNRLREVSTDQETGDVLEWLIELALRLASDPAHVEDWAGQHLRDGLTYLMEVPSLARAARFLIIATERGHQQQPVSGEIYASWKWESDA